MVPHQMADCSDGFVDMPPIAPECATPPLSGIEIDEFDRAHPGHGPGLTEMRVGRPSPADEAKADDRTQ